jgi:murein DD-endopeptidase MepM/ murein hydrolase activator NlpD
MTSRLLLGLTLLLALATPASADTIGQQKQAVDTKIEALNGKLAAVQHQQGSLRDQIDSMTARIRALEGRVGDVALQLQALNQDLALRRQRLDKLNRLFHLQTVRQLLLQAQYRLAVDRLNARLVAIYESPDVSTLDVVFGSTSIQEALDKSTYLSLIGQQDRQVAEAVDRSKHAIRIARKRTAQLRARVEGDARALAVRAAQTTEARNALVGAQTSLDSAKQQKLSSLSALSAAERELADEIAREQAASAQLGAQIRAAQASNNGPTATPSSAGLIWPVQGPITSPFGPRWGGFHYGIDIGVPTGTPIHAAAGGKVIYCGWEGGYGNLVVLDNGGNLATAYAHQSAIAVTCGQDVSQGDVIGYVGCTGHCFGPHLHFEVRIDGNPVDPLGYL